MSETMQSPISVEQAVANRVVMIWNDEVRVMPGSGEFPEGAETKTAQEWAEETGLGVEAVRSAFRSEIVPTSNFGSPESTRDS